VPFCPNCGKTGKGEDLFCSACGHKLQPTVQEYQTGILVLALMGSTIIALSYFCYHINTTWYLLSEGETSIVASRAVAALFCPLGVIFDAFALLSALYTLKIGNKKLLMIIVSIFLCLFLYIGIDLLIINHL